MTSHGCQAGGCHGDTWASLPLGRSTRSDPASGSARTITRPSGGSRGGCTSPTPTSVHAHCRLQRPLPVARREPRPRTSQAFHRAGRARRTTIPRMLHDTELHFPEAKANVYGFPSHRAGALPSSHWLLSVAGGSCGKRGLPSLCDRTV